MNRRSTAEQIFYVFGVLAPGATILLARFVGTGPALASAALTDPGAPVLPDPRGPATALTGDDASAWAAAQSRVTLPLKGTPFAPADLIQTSDPTRPGTPGSHQRASSTESPTVVLTAIASLADGPLAVIDGRHRRLGDVVQPGWRVAQIDASRQTVTLRHDQGHVHALELRTRRVGD